MQYRKKPVVIEAVLWAGDNEKEIMDFLGWRNACCDKKDGLRIHTLEGTMHAAIGDYIIKGVKGEFYSCKPDIFAQSYEDAALRTQPQAQDAGVLQAVAVRWIEIDGNGRFTDWKYASGDEWSLPGHDHVSTVEYLYNDEALKQSLAQPAQESFQDRVQPWMQACFGPEISADRLERNHRFFEESTELVQSLGMPQHEAHALVDYVYGRPVGEPVQEVGGVMVTLAALCLASGLNMHEAGEIELKRIWTKVEQIRAKQAAKPRGSALPIVQQPAQEPIAWIVFDDDEGCSMYCATWPEACHEHINDAINEFQIEGAEKWKVVPVFAQQPAQTAVPEGLNIALKALDELSCLGNGERQGTSIGNEIAQRAAAKIRSLNAAPESGEGS